MTSTMTASTKVKATSSSRRHINWQKQGVAYLFLLPALIIFTLVTWYPILNTILYSFQKVNLGGFQGWVWLLHGGLARIIAAWDLDARPFCELFEGLHEAQAFDVAQKADGIARGLAAEAVVEVATARDAERWAFFRVKRA